MSFVDRDARVTVSANPEEIRNAGHLVLPGQGAIGTWFGQLIGNQDLMDAVVERLKSGPVLGICLGLQAFYDASEENGGIQGLGVLKGQVHHFSTHPAHQYDSGTASNDATVRLKIPHMGWNRVSIKNPHPLWHGIENGERFYFVHSYYAETENPDQVMGECEYGNIFTAAAGTNNLFATQFHPEKSQHAGLQLLKNFLNWNGAV
jgi:glutamine amidotransferase